MVKLGLCQVCLGHLGLNESGQSFDDTLWERCPVMAPSPHLHATNPKVFGYFGIATESHFEREIVPSAQRFSFEARWGYGIETHGYRPIMKYSVRAPSGT
jgi:hypothetical protein